MYREIKKTIYRIKTYSGRRVYVECDTKEDLLRFIATSLLDQHYTICSVCEICADGSTPKVRVFSDPRYKKIYQEMQKQPLSEDEEVVKSLTPMQLALAYELKEHSYLKDDAYNHLVDKIGEDADKVSEADLEYLISRFEKCRDCEIPENAVWDMIASEYLEGKKEKE